MLKQWYFGLHKILHGCHGHGKVMDFLEFMEKLWNFGQKLTGSWKSHGIFKLEQKVIEKAWNFTNKFLILMNRRHCAEAFQNPTEVYVD